MGASGTTKERGNGLNPGDEAAPGTVGTGEDVCPDCRGTGRIGQGPCSTCGGSGKITEGIGGG